MKGYWQNFIKCTAKTKSWFQYCLKFTNINDYEADPGGRAMCGRSIAVIADSKPAEGMDVRLLCLLGVGYVAASATSWPFVQRSPIGGVCLYNYVWSRNTALVARSQ